MNDERRIPADIRRDSAEIGALFDRMADRYDEVVPFFTLFAADLVRWAGPPVNGTVLDLCTGDGACLAALAQRMADGALMGVDLSRLMLMRVGIKRTMPMASSLRVAQANAYQLPFANSVFDAFYCSLSWHFFRRPGDVLAELSRIGRPTARLAVSVLGPSRHTWPFMGSVLGKYVPQMVAENHSQGDGRGVEAILRAGGWIVKDTKREQREFEFGGAEEWLEWLWSQTARMYFERVDGERRTALLESLLFEAEKAFKQKGLRLEQQVILMCASME